MSIQLCVLGTLASGAPPRERKDAVWAGSEVAGGLWVLRARSARFSMVKRARTHTHLHTHTHRHTRTAVQGAPIRRIRPAQSILVLTCCARRTESPNPAYFGWRQEMRARDSGHKAASAGLFVPAVSLRAVDRFVLAHGTCLRSAGCSASDLELRMSAILSALMFDHYQSPPAVT